MVNDQSLVNTVNFCEFLFQYNNRFNQQFNVNQGQTEMLPKKVLVLLCKRCHDGNVDAEAQSSVAHLVLDGYELIKASWGFVLTPKSLASRKLCFGKSSCFLLSLSFIISWMSSLLTAT